MRGGFGLAAHGDNSMRGMAYAEAAASRAAFAQLAWSQPMSPMVVQASYTPDAYAGQNYYPYAQPQWSPYSAYAPYEQPYRAWHPRHPVHHPHPIHHPYRPHHPQYRGYNGYAPSYAGYYGDQGNYAYQQQYPSQYYPSYPSGYSDYQGRGYSQDYGRYDGYYGRTYDSNRRPDSRYAASNAQIVASVAREMGFTRQQTLACIATMLVESRGDAHQVGDHGHSVGLFQLNDRGEGAGLTVGQRMDPHLNASIALQEFRRCGFYGNPGTWAATAQRPKYRGQFADMVNAMLPAANRLLQAGGDDVYMA